MKGVKTTKLVHIRPTCKVRLMALPASSGLWLPSVIACRVPITWSLSCEPPTDYYYCTGEKDPCKTYRCGQR